MKNFILKAGFLSLLFFIFLFTLQAQVPQGINYQAVARDAAGEVIPETELKVRIGILTNVEPPIVVYEAQYSVTTNSFGLFQLMVGDPLATPVTGSFSDIDWTVQPLFIRTSVYWNKEWQVMGSSELLSVPYAFVAQDISGLDKLSIKGETADMDEALFEVKNNLGNTVFAVYNEGVRVNVGDGAKGLKGGFAIGSFDQTKGESQEYMRVTSDSIRIYIDNSGKAVKGGFAIGSFNQSKSKPQEYMRVTEDSTRIYVSNSSGKASKGGFAIGGFDQSKGTGTGNFLDITPKNYFIGQGSGSKVTTGLYNSVLGYKAAHNLTTGQSNTIIGHLADSSITIGNNNIIIGDLAGFKLTTGNHNTLIGSSAGYNHTNQEYNIMIGTNAGTNINASGWGGSFNTFMGINSGYQIRNSRDNVFIGTNAGYWLDNGQGNTFVGIDAGRSRDDGQNPYRPEVNALNNVFMGNKAGYHITNGDNNLAIGYMAGYNNADGSGNVLLGYRAGYSETGSNKLYIANSSVNPPLIYGDFLDKKVGINTTTINKTLNVGGDAEITGNLTAGSVSAPVTGNLTGNVTGNLSGNVTGNVAGDVTGKINGMSMGRIFLTGDSPILTLDNGNVVLNWLQKDAIIEIRNNGSKNCSYWCLKQEGASTTGNSGVFAIGYGGTIISANIESVAGFEIHFGYNDNSGNTASVWLQYYNGALSGHYIIY
ncbi:MAG TPA: hypothetical protein PLN06_04350 [Bacteroidales bacterium]|nr:hypothetical protein [Bacteroidales bacterium]HOU95838.1 hypothetical protein [Bacteroidales bacterium]HQG37232.1 hypothetical protein [Bacteroidales bacterium]HQG52611.1 hypothetical protein [Bacteroidales bacterium]HQJ20383.1 hypothetical protein [Bacteroidales bacterium]